jgi:hypothetical protein
MTNPEVQQAAVFPKTYERYGRNWEFLSRS